ncbi:FIG00732405: hypothetical protein [Klebsiella pneumoniae IS39]|nr:FIG00732405: hypothetical protein [Klebsiella pneumoniae IS39]
MQQTPHQRKTLTERVIHAITFEGLATLILAPTAAWLMQRSVVEMGGLSILLATLAMVWNIIYNAAFDRLWPVSRFPRQLKVRALHALGSKPDSSSLASPWWRSCWASRCCRRLCWRSVLCFSSCPTPWPLTGYGTPCASALFVTAARARRRAVNPGADLRRSAATLSPKTIATDEP